MDHSDACETCYAGAPVLVCRGPRRLPTSPPSRIVHSLVARSLTPASHRVSPDDTSTTPSTVIIRVRPLRSWKHELRRTRRALHTIHILSSCRTLGRILREHARASLRLSLPDPSSPLLEVALSTQVLRDVHSVSRALPNTPLDLGPHSHNVPGIRALDLERNTPLNPPEINSWNHPRRRSPGRTEKHHLRHPHRRRRHSNQTAYQRRPIHVLGQPGRRATLHSQWTVRKLDYPRGGAVRLFRAPVQGLVWKT